MNFLRRWFGPKSLPQACVDFDDEQVTRILGNGRIETVQWDDLREVGVLTTDEGPFLDDVFFVLTGTNGNGCTIPNNIVGMEELLSRLQRLPGFDNATLSSAMCSAQNAKFVCWKRSGQTNADSG